MTNDSGHADSLVKDRIPQLVVRIRENLNFANTGQLKDRLRRVSYRHCSTISYSANVYASWSSMELANSIRPRRPRGMAHEKSSSI